MSTRTVYVRSDGDDRSVARDFRDGIVVDVFADKQRATVSHTVAKIVQRTGPPTAPAIDLFLLAAAVYLADKRTLRGAAADRWTRTFRVSTLAQDAAAWRTQQTRLTSALRFLTGDNWQLRFRERRGAALEPAHTAPRRYEAVCLFSGGLDSLAGAIKLLATMPGRVLLVAHHDGGLIEGVQEDLAERLADHFGASRVDLVTVLARPAPARSQEFPLPDEHENTTRSRSLMFLALAFLAASACGPNVPVWIPENAYISLNVPLTGARVGSLSTRTTHPQFIADLAAVVGGVGLANPIRNPFDGMTKGEVLVRSPRKDLLARLAPRTISCAHPEASRYDADPSKRRFANCGYCYPCIVRRAAMRHAGWDRGGDYLYDVLRDPRLLERGSGRGGDVRAVVAMIRQRAGLSRSPLAVLRGGPLPPGTDLAGLAAMHRRGTDELRELLSTASGRVKKLTE